MVLITINEYVKKNTGIFTRITMTIWSISLILTGLLASQQITKTTKIIEDNSAFQSKIKYNSASHLFSIAKDKKDTQTALKALKIAKEAINLANLNKQKVIKKLDSDNAEYKNLVKKITTYIQKKKNQK